MVEPVWFSYRHPTGRRGSKPMNGKKIGELIATVLVLVVLAVVIACAVKFIIWMF